MFYKRLQVENEKSEKERELLAKAQTKKKNKDEATIYDNQKQY